MSATALPSQVPAPESKGVPNIFVIGGDVKVDGLTSTVTARDGTTIPLKPYEYRVFYAVARHTCKGTDEPLPWPELLSEIYGTKLPDSNSCEALLSKVRRHLRNKKSLIGIKGVRGKGPRLIMLADGSTPKIDVLG